MNKSKVLSVMILCGLFFLWCFNTLAQQKIAAHTGAVNDIEFSKDGKQLLTCGADQKVTIWNVSDGSVQLELSEFSAPVIACAFSPDGRLVATAQQDKWIKTWEASTGALIKSFGKSASGGFMSQDLLYSRLEFANSEDLVAMGGYVLGGLYQLNTFSAKTGVKKSSIPSKEFFISMDVFDEGSRVVTSSSNYGGTSSLSIYDLITNERKIVVATGINDQYVAISPDHQHVAMGGRGDRLTLFDIQSGKKVYERKSGYSMIKQLVFSDDGQFIVTASQFDLVVWDKNRGQKIKQIKLESEIAALATHGGLLSVGLASGSVVIYDDLFDQPEEESAPMISKSEGLLALDALGAEPMIVLERGIHQARVPAVKYTADGQQIVTASWDKTIRIWNASSGDQERVIRVPAWKGLEGQIFDMDVSKDKKYIIAAGASLGIRNEVKTADYIGEYVLLIDFQTGQILDVNPVHNQTIQSISFSPDGNFVVSGGGEVDSRVVTFRLDRSRGKLIKMAERNMAEASKNYYPSCDDRDFYGGLCSNRIIGVDFVPQTNEVISIDIMGMLVKHAKDLSSYQLIGESLNRKTAGSLGKISNNAMFRILAVDPQGRYVAAGDYSGLVTLFDLNSKTPHALTKGQSYENPLINIPSFGTFLMAMAISADGSQLGLASDNKVRIYSIDLSGTPKNLTTPLMEFSHKEDVMGLAFSPDGKSLISTGINPEECLVWDLNSGEQRKKLAPTSKFELLSAVGTNAKFPNEIGFGRGLNSNAQINYFGRVSKSFDLSKLELKKVKSPYAFKTARELSRGTTPPQFDSPLGDQLMSYLPLGNGHTAIGSSYGLFIDNHTNPIAVDGLTTYGLTLSADKKRFITGLENGLIRIFNIEDGSQVASLFVNEEDDWVLWTPEGYYTASLKGAQSVAWQTNLGPKSTPGYYPFEQFDLILNRPDLVLEKLGGADPELIHALRQAYLKRLRKMDLKEQNLKASFELPLLEIELLSQEVDSAPIEIPVKAKDKVGLKRLHVFVNDVAVFGQKGKAIAGLTYNQPISMTLTPGVNKIQFSVLNTTGVMSLTQTRYVTFQAPEEKGNLFVISIGVSDYQDDEFDLNYAAKDANDIADLFESKQASYDGFTKVVITNNDVTKEGILALKSQLMKTSVNDQVVIFVAGHGLLDEDYNYFFATHDIDFYNPSERGLAYEDLEGLLDGIPAREKLLLIDACHSGEVDEEDFAGDQGASNLEQGVTSRGFKNTGAKKKLGVEKSVDLMAKYFNDLRKGTGAMIISSASGVEFAFESSLWQNGVFTYAVLDGLQSNKCDSDKDGKVQISELRNFVFDRVKDLTNDKQHPTSRRENLEFDFVVH